jgi:hypothetical protein
VRRVCNLVLHEVLRHWHDVVAVVTEKIRQGWQSAATKDESLAIAPIPICVLAPFLEDEVAALS